MVTPAMFMILASVTCILLIAILIATSDGKRSALDSPNTTHASLRGNGSRPISKGASAAMARPRIRQGLDTKAVAKATLAGTRSELAKLVNSEPLADRNVKPVISAPTLVSRESPAQTAARAVATPYPAAPAELAVAPTLSSMIQETVPSSVTDDCVAQVFASPAREVTEAKNVLPFIVQEANVAKASALQDQERSKGVESASLPLAVDGSPNSGPFLVPAQDTAATAEMLLALVTENGASEFVAPIAREAAESKVPQELFEEPDDEFRAPNLLAFYGLTHQPFDLTPDPAYLYRSRCHREAFATLSRGIENLRGFMALIAEPGMGNTTLLNKLMEDLRDSARVVFLFQTQCNSSELLRYLLSELGVEHDGTDIVAMHRALSRALFEEMLQGRRFVLIVDEAQNLQDSVLETIRLLSNYETTRSKMIQIVLAGQPQLVDTLMRPGLAQLRQRIALHANLVPLDVAETAEYIEHRLRAAGSGDMPIFTRDAMTLIAERSEGIPRSINNICFNAMLAGYLHKQLMIDSETVERVASKLDLERLVRRPQQEPVSISSADLTAKNQPDAALVSATKEEPKASLSLTGRLTEKLASQSWSNKSEFRIQVSLERDYSPGLPVAEHYYCRSFYVSDEQAKSLQPGKAVRVKFEQD